MRLIDILVILSCCSHERQQHVEQGGGAIAILGDSISLYYPDKLRAELGPDFTVDNYAVGGTSSYTIMQKWRSDVRGKDYGAVVIMAGVNDLVGFQDPDITHNSLSALYSEPQEDGLTVYVLTILPIPDRDPPRVVTNEKIPELNAWIVEQPGVNVIDTWAAFGGAAPDLTLYQGDLLHPDDEGQQVIADLVAERFR